MAKYAELSGGRVIALIACGIPTLLDVALTMPGDDVAANAKRELREGRR
ncbi:hypothetical protein BJ970_003508 [Saccharopolyspora phatthalungensis]|uniref:Uncharacterized protein n=1 Tax=Saccharopolyspora phatthalungensis TaxID=664693 RepID=A0A840Q5T0_9PSEU|nr:hypothetical protein [Saccharopolyspora phatthalungensis]